MSVGMKNRGLFSNRVPEPQSDDDLRRDRMTALVVFIIMLAVVALVVWLGSFNGGGGGAGNGMEYWHMMP